MNVERTDELVNKERNNEIKKKLFKEVGEVLKKAGFKRHRTKRSTWWRRNGNEIQGFNFQRSQFSHNYMVNLTTQKANNIDNVETFSFDFGNRMSGLFMDGEDKQGFTKLNALLDFNDLPEEYEGDAPEDQQIQQFKQLLEGFIPIYFDTLKGAEDNHQKIIDLLK